MGNKKRGIGRIVWLALLFIVLLAFVLILDRPTGFATLDRSSLKQQVADFVQQYPLTKFTGSGSAICIEIPSAANEIFAYDVSKSENKVIVKDAAPGCDGQLEEDFILHFNDQPSFLNLAASKECDMFPLGGRGGDFYFYPSRLW